MRFNIFFHYFCRITDKFSAWSFLIILFCPFCRNVICIIPFKSEKLKDQWMDQAPEYNPHLVGPRWTVLGPLEVLEQLKSPLSGDLHLMDHRVSQTPTPK